MHSTHVESNRGTEYRSTGGSIEQYRRCHNNKWKNHFYEMKGDIGMSLHEKKGTRRCLHQDTKSLITPSLHLCFALTCCLFARLSRRVWRRFVRVSLDI